MKKKTSIDPRAYSACIGLDWARKKHVYCLRPRDGEMETGALKHDPLEIEKWLDGLAERFGGRPVAVCLEDSRQAVIAALENAAHLDLFLVNPATAANYRKMFTPSGDKNDERDAESLLDFFLCHSEKLRLHVPVDPDVRELVGLCRGRRKAVDERTRHLARLHERLLLDYPLADKILGESLEAPMALDFLKRWPSQEKLLRCRETTLLAFFHKHNCRSRTLIEERMSSFRSTGSLRSGTGADPNSSIHISQEISQIAVLNKTIASYDKAIAGKHKENKNAAVFDSVPGAGSCLAPRLLAAFSVIQPESAQQMCRLSGIAPIRVQSGKTHRTFMRRHCSRFLRQSFHEFAGASIRYSKWAKAYYHYQTKVKGVASQAAKRSLAFKWIRILFACWKNNTPYNEELYIQSLRRSNSPLIQYLTAP